MVGTYKFPLSSAIALYIILSARAKTSNDILCVIQSTVHVILYVHTSASRGTLHIAPSKVHAIINPPSTLHSTLVGVACHG